MCDTCGCNITDGNRHLIEGEGRLAKTGEGREAVEGLQGLLHENDHQAAHNREHFDSRGVLAVNLMSSPGAGKTALLDHIETQVVARGGVVVRLDGADLDGAAGQLGQARDQLLAAVDDLHRRGRDVEIVGVSPSLQQVLALGA